MLNLHLVLEHDNENVSSLVHDTENASSHLSTETQNKFKPSTDHDSDYGFELDLH